MEAADDVDPAFLIVGTARSGTTLVQRLASELAGVEVPPETHFFASGFANRLATSASFPLRGTELDEVVGSFAGEAAERGLSIDPALVMARLGGQCSSVMELFGAVVRALAPDATLVGEKTPMHLRWWCPITRQLPALKLIAVVRDPRAVFASQRKLDWGNTDPSIAARRWGGDQRQVRAATVRLGAERSLVLRYEDVVADPDAARQAIGALLGVEVEVRDRVEGDRLFLPHEDWKRRALEPISSDRVEAWRDELAPNDEAVVLATCRAEMLRFGYAVTRRPSIGPLGLRVANLRYRRSLARRLAAQDRIF